jgi:PAS domain S-box-containing protein
MADPDCIRILLVEDNPGDTRLLHELLKEAPGLPSEVMHVERLAAAACVLSEHNIDLVLLDLSLPDASGLAALKRVHSLTPSTPIVVLTGLDDEELALRAVKEGAQDFLVKGRVDGPILSRSIRYAIERNRAEEMESQLLQAQAAQKEAEVGERRFHGLADAIPQIVWEFNANGQFDYISTRWFEYTGLAPADNLLLSFAAAMHPEDAGQALELWAESTQTGKAWQSEYRLRRADGSYRWHLGRAVPARGKDGTLRKWYGTATDIDDQKRNEHERQRLYQQAQQAVKSRDELLATVSHDLRNPLSTIAMGATLILSAPTDDAQSKLIHSHAEKIDRAAKRMEHLIRDLLDIASIESGHLSIHPRTTRLCELYAETLDAMQPAAHERKLQLSSDFPDEDTVVHCDRERVLQVLMNIVGNAIKFTGAGGAIGLRCEVRPHDVCLSVADTGPGINEHDLPRVFDRFWQAKETARAGVGLGLAICKGIINQHQGTIWVESVDGKGTTFYFTLPRAPAGSPADHVLASSPRPRSSLD